MQDRYNLIFDDVITRQLKKAAKNGVVKQRLISLLDKLEEKGPEVGELIDSNLSVYELKAKHPPIRLYFVPSPNSKEIKVFEFEMKTSPEKQKETINKLRKRISKS